MKGFTDNQTVEMELDWWRQIHRLSMASREAVIGKAGRAKQLGAKVHEDEYLHAYLEAIVR